jgi:hypothetical protein
MRPPTIFADFAYEFGRCICYRNGDEREIMWVQSSPGTGTARSQGRRMLKNDLENLELDRLENESRKLVAERKKLLAEEKKLNRETNLYPLAVTAGVVTAITAVAGVFFKF